MAVLGEVEVRKEGCICRGLGFPQSYSHGMWIELEWGVCCKPDDHYIPDRRVMCSRVNVKFCH